MKAGSLATPRWRYLSVCCVLIGLAVLLMGRLVMLQVTEEGQGAVFLREQGAMRTVRTAEIPVYRGLIEDRHGTPLAISSPVVSLWANPQQLKDSPRLAELSALLGVDAAVLKDKLALYGNKHFMYLARHQAPDFARQILQERFPGVRGERAYRRYYPAGEVTAQVLGLTNVDGEGIAGIELAFEQWLQGVPGKKRFIKDLHGDAVRDFGLITKPRPGKALSLSLDLRLQYVQHRELQRAMKETGAVAGSAITIDAWTGEILAVSNYPVFNPNNREAFDYSAARNRALTDVYEPGSTIKTLTLIAALESGQFTIDSLVDTAPGRIRVGSKVLHDPRNYGEISVSKIIEKSSQVGVTKLAQAVGHEAILEVLLRFGFGTQTGTGFPGERAGSLPSMMYWSEIEKVTVAFGYGLNATPIQLAQAYSILANDGVRQPLTLLKQDRETLPVGKRVVDAQVAQDVLQVLGRVTSAGGTATLAQVPGFSVGGKTGTVHKVGSTGYLDDQYVALFVGVAPMKKPRYVTTILIDQPRGDHYGGGLAAAPVYSRITEEVLRIRNAQPDRSSAGALVACVPRVAAMMGLRELLADQTLPEVSLGNMTLDSRDVQPNTIFIAVPGAEHDGRDFIHAALEQGAGVVLAEADGRELPHDHRVIAIADLRDQIGVLADRFYRSPSRHLKVMAVTGTNGKTSIVELTRQLLQAVGLKAGSIGTLGSRLFGPPTEARNTTPDCITLHRQLRVWRDASVDVVAMEASSHALDQRRLDGLAIDVAVFTNLSRDHLDYHHSMEAYGESKFKLFRDFTSSAQIYNADDNLLSSHSDIWGRNSVGISFSDESADVLIGMISVAPLVFTLRTPWGDAQIDSLLAGRFNAFNLTVAIVAAASMGVPFTEIIAVTNQLKPVPGRLEPIEMASDITVVIDYAHTPDALHRAITAVSEAQHKGCIWVLFGCGGDRDHGKRSEMGAVAARLADRIVVTSDNPRGEAPEAIIQDILLGCEGAAPLVEVDRATAISLVIAEAAAGDTVLIAGKGHETYQEIAGARIPFSDVQCANHYLAQRRAA